MSWHILRKDFVLLWPWIILSALAQIGLNGLMFAVDHTPDSPRLLPVARLFVLVVFLAIALTISQAVHQDAIPGTRQDWLTRPIPRRDVLLAKLLFVLVAVQLPMFLGDLLEMTGQGFTLKAAAIAASSRNLYVFVALSLPTLGFAAMTRNTVQLIAVGIAYFLAIAGATLLLSAVASVGAANPATNPIAWTGVAWVSQALARLVLAAGASLALLLLYGRRRIAQARCVLALFVISSALASVLPWKWAFAAEQAVADQPVGDALAISIDSAAPRYVPPPGESLDEYGVGAAQVELQGRSPGDIESENRRRRADHNVTVFIPIRIAGLPARAIPWVDRALVTLRRQDGRIVFQGLGDDLKLAERQASTSSLHAYEAIRVSGLLYETAKDTPLRVQVDYWLSVLRPKPAVAIAALAGRARLPGFGRCATDRDPDGQDLELQCLKAGNAPSCVSATLEDPATGRRNPETRICAPNYAPFDTKLFPDAVSRFQVEAPFRDSLQLARYPVNGTDLGRARLILTRYDASEHVQGHLTAKQVLLTLWTAGRDQPH